LLELPLFPLRTVLFPGGPLPLRVFEARYLDMIGRCLRQQERFGVVLIKEGSETGAARTFEIGTLAEIVDWYQGTDGVLGITVEGRDRFRLLSSTQREDGLYVGRVELLPAEPREALPREHARLASVLEVVLDKLGRHYQELPRAYGDATWVGYRLAEIMPLAPEMKQELLELDDACERLARLGPRLAE